MFAPRTIDARLLASRVEVIRDVLERYDELVDPSIGRNGEKGNGEQPPEMPVTYTPTLKELERLLRLMRLEDRRLWWHVTERYIRCQTRIQRDVVEKRKVKGKGEVTALVDRLQTTYDPKVDPLLVDAGIEWLARSWRLVSEPMRPKGGKDARFPWDRE